MVNKSEAYVDTSALIAFSDRSDRYHQLFSDLFSQPPKLITTPLVIAEGHGWFLKRYNRDLASRFLAMIELLTPLTVVSFGKSEQLAAFRVIRKFSDQDLTLTDAAGLAIMNERGIESCWSTDFHLGLTGVQLVIHQ